MLTLDLNHTIAHSTARTAMALQFRGQLGYLRIAEGEPRDHRYDFSAAPLRSARNAHGACSRPRGFAARILAGALRHRALAAGTDAPGVAPVNDGHGKPAYALARAASASAEAAASATATALMSTMRRTVDEGVMMCTGCAMPSRMPPTMTPPPPAATRIAL